MSGRLFVVAFQGLMLLSLAMTLIWIMGMGLASVLERNDQRDNPFVGAQPEAGSQLEIDYAANV